MAKEICNLLVNIIVEKELKRCACDYAKGMMIDIGCGVKPYQPFFKPFIREHVGLDFEGSLHDRSNVNITGTAYSIPVQDTFFDTALCTAVLEHLEEPEQALRECHRVLKQGAFAIYTVPFIWHLHEEPRDFFRFTKYGLVYLFEKTGFEVVELKAMSGFWVTFGQLFVYNLYRLNTGVLRWLRIVDIIGLIIQAIAYVLDKIDKTEKWTWMYLVVARKS